MKKNGGMHLSQLGKLRKPPFIYGQHFLNGLQNRITIPEDKIKFKEFNLNNLDRIQQYLAEVSPRLNEQVNLLLPTINQTLESLTDTGTKVKESVDSKSSSILNRSLGLVYSFTGIKGPTLSSENVSKLTSAITPKNIKNLVNLIFPITSTQIPFLFSATKILQFGRFIKSIAITFDIASWNKISSNFNNIIYDIIKAVNRNKFDQERVEKFLPTSNQSSSVLDRVREIELTRSTNTEVPETVSYYLVSLDTDEVLLFLVNYEFLKIYIYDMNIQKLYMEDIFEIKSSSIIPQYLYQFFLPSFNLSFKKYSLIFNLNGKEYSTIREESIKITEVDYDEYNKTFQFNGKKYYFFDKEKLCLYVDTFGDKLERFYSLMTLLNEEDSNLYNFFSYYFFQDLKNQFNIDLVDVD